MNILSVTFDDDMWQEVSQFAQSCSWRAGKALWSYVKKKYKLNMPFLRLAYPARASAFSSNAA